MSKPVLGRVSGKWSIQMSRRLNRPDGGFGGVAVVSVDPFQFSNFYKDVDLGHGGSLTLVGLDGIVRARQASADSSVGQDISSGAVFKQAVAAAGRDFVVQGRSAVDGVERIFTVRPLAGYPFLVVVGVSVEAALGSYEHKRSETYTVAGLTTSS